MCLSAWFSCCADEKCNRRTTPNSLNHYLISRIKEEKYFSVPIFEKKFGKDFWFHTCSKLTGYGRFLMLKKKFGFNKWKPTNQLLNISYFASNSVTQAKWGAKLTFFFLCSAFAVSQVPSKFKLSYTSKSNQRIIETITLNSICFYRACFFYFEYLKFRKIFYNANFTLSLFK